MALSFCGIDIAAKTFVAELETGERVDRFELPNTTAGRQRLCSRLERLAGPVRVCFEPTGSYSEGLAWALHVKPYVELSVPNPHALRSFAKALLSRSKTDRIDAGVAREFAKRMDLQPWTPPTREQRELRAIARRIDDLVGMATEEKNRLHALEAADAPRVVVKDVTAQIKLLESRIDHMREAALALIRVTPELTRRFELLVSIPGIGQTSAVQVLAEIAHLPVGMTPRQWVAYAGLDPRQHQSGSSVRKPPQISRRGNSRLRTSLFLPAMVAITHCAEIRAYHQHLVDRGKTWRQAQIAVMRKLLHAIHGMFQHNTPFDPTRFYRD